MVVVGIVLLVFFIISAILLVVLVLVQDEQGEGLGGLFGGGSSTPFGSRSGNILTKFTSIIAAVFFVCSFGMAWINRSPEKGDVVGAARRNQPQTEATEWWSTPAAEPTQNPEQPTQPTE